MEFESTFRWPAGMYNRYIRRYFTIDNYLLSIAENIVLFLNRQDYEFVIYMTDEVTDVSDGKLRIKPILTNDKLGDNFVTQGNLVLEQ